MEVLKMGIVNDRNELTTEMNEDVLKICKNNNIQHEKLGSLNEQSENRFERFQDERYKLQNSKKLKFKYFFPNLTHIILEILSTT